MAKVSKKQLRRLNHRAGGGCTVGPHDDEDDAQTAGKVTQGIGTNLRRREAPDRYQKVTRSWINANVLGSWGSRNVNPPRISGNHLY